MLAETPRLRVRILLEAKLQGPVGDAVGRDKLRAPADAAVLFEVGGGLAEVAGAVDVAAGQGASGGEGGAAVRLVQGADGADLAGAFRCLVGGDDERVERLR